METERATPDESPAISVVVPARDASGTISNTLAGLARQRCDAPFEVIIVDNGSLDETASLAESHALKPRVIRRKRGEGAGAARNDGAAAARGAILAFTDSDCAPDPLWLDRGLRAMTGADLVQGAVRPPPETPVGPFDRTMWISSEYGLYETANLFVRREWYERLGGFRDWIPDRGKGGSSNRPFGEDVWFAWRAKREGARTAFESDAVVYHAVFPGTARQYVAEQWRLRHFPGLLSRIPELRDGFAWNRWFLSGRTAAFDAAIAGAIAAIALGSWIPLVAAAPYLAALVKGMRSGGEGVRHRLLKTGVTPARDAVGFAALIAGSVRARSVLL